MIQTELENGFRNPPARFLPAPFWFLNDRLSPEEMRRQVRLMHGQHIGGFFMHARMGRETPYLSEEWLECIEAAVDEASRLGMRAWFYDEDNWPSGYAGGKVLDLGEWTLGRFARAEVVPVEPSAGMPVFDGVLAGFEIRGDGDETEVLARLDEDALGTIRGGGKPVPSDRRTEAFLVFFLELHRGEREFCPEEKVNGYIDVLNPRVVDAFIDSTYEVYRERLGRWFGGALAGSFFDEPQYHELGLWGGPPRFPWTDGFAERYRERSGRDIFADLPSLLFDTGEHRKVRYEYYRTLTELFSGNFTAKLASWCEEHGIELTGHLILEEHPRQAARCIGNAMQHYLYPHIPGIDHLGKDLDLAMYWSSSRVLCKQGQSAANQLGREQVMCETFAGGTNYFGIPDQKWMGDWMNALGVNFLCYHAFHYSMRGYRKRDYPPTFNYQQPWFPLSGGLALHFGRLAWALSLGKRKADVLLIHPMESVWATQRDDNFTGENDFISEALKSVSDSLIRSGFDWDFGDEEYLARFGSTENGKLRVGEGAYRAVIVPPGVTLRTSTLDLLEAFRTGGGLILRVSPSPSLADAEPSERCAALMAAVPDTGPWDRGDLTAALMNALGRKLTPQVAAETEAAAASEDLGEIVFQERQISGGRIFFFATASKTPHTAKLSVAAAGSVFLMDTRTASFRPFPHRNDGERIHLSLDFSMGRSYLLLVREDVPATETPFRQPQRFSPAVHRLPLIRKGERLDFSRESPNTLILERTELTFGGETEKLYTIQAGARLAERGPALPQNGRAFSAEFTFRSEIPLFDTVLLLETPERFSVSLDGRRIEKRDEGWFADRSLRKIPLPRRIPEGVHRITLSGVWEAGLELEPLYLAGNFGVYFSRTGTPYLDAEPGKLALADIGTQGYPFYAGIIDYGFSFEYGGGGCVLETGEGKAVREILVNGKSAGTLSWPPYEADISGHLVPGKNSISIRAATHLRNFYGPHHVADEDSIDCFSPADHFGGEAGFTGRYLTRPAGLTDEIALRITEERI